MTTIGVRSPRVPLSTTRAPARTDPVAGAGWIRVGTIDLRSALSYLGVWALVLFAVLVLVLAGGYVVLAVLGVTGSVSRALAIIVDQPLPASGVLPALRPQFVVPSALLLSALLAVLWLACALAAVLVHNAVSTLTGGLRVRIRSDVRTQLPRT